MLQETAVNHIRNYLPNASTAFNPAHFQLLTASLHECTAARQSFSISWSEYVTRLAIGYILHQLRTFSSKVNLIQRLATTNWAAAVVLLNGNYCWTALINRLTVFRCEDIMIHVTYLQIKYKTQ